ncbi:DinB family protein [Sporichthya polymorpha]|uniref:DinB family protein n=1 Tax=Sporichthya polymorpha TaxID=35751 RepID=UPI00037077AC|nr:DinB family protein [Sporichthya polymorpha]
MTEIADRSVTGVRCRDLDVRQAGFWNIRMRDAWIQDVEIDGDVENLRINGIDVGPLIEAELDRRYPLRPKMRPTDLAGFREAVDILETLWARTATRARALPPELLHERVDDEWSFVQTLRHLLFATDIWISRAILGNPRPWHPLGLPFEEMEPHPEIPVDHDARPFLDEVLTLRAERYALLRRVLDDLTPEGLVATTEPVEGPGYPPAGRYPVAKCLTTVLNEEWQHRLYAERDLDALESRRTR